MPPTTRQPGLAIAFVWFLGCSAQDSVTPHNDSTAGGAAGASVTDDASCPDSCNPLTNRQSSLLFDWPTVPEFSFTLPADRWEYLKLHAAEELYEPADVSFNGQGIGSIGLRFKGSWGTLYSCVDESGNLTCDKLSMFVKFDKYDDNMRFFGLKRLNLHSMVRDPSKLHDRLAYDLYRSQGVFAPRSSWANLVVNGERLGLFAMVEAIDGRFTDDRWAPDGDGNLYKEAWPSSAEASYYASHLETNEETATHDGFIAFAEALAAAPAGRRSSTLFNYMDRDNLYRHLAINDAINNWDGIAVFSCYLGACTNHNYFIYQEQSRPYFWLVPWDLDGSFSLSSPVAPIPHWQYPIADCTPTLFLNGALKMAPACDPLFAALGEDLSGYRDAIDALLAGEFSESTVTAAIDRHAAFIGEAMRNDPHGGGVAPWQSAIQQLKAELSLLRLRLTRLRDQIPMVPLTLKPSTINGFEGEDALTLALGQFSMSNSATSYRTSIVDAAALAGSRSLRIDFEFRNEPIANPAWSQWSFTQLSLGGGAQDLSAKSGIRMLFRTDRPRVVSVSLNSPRYSLTKHFGWDTNVATTPTTVKLPFANAAVPAWQGDTSDSLATILTAVDSLSIAAGCAGRNGDGLLPDGTSDPGFLEIDAIEFYTE